jgi:hypothetical protein
MEVALQVRIGSGPRTESIVSDNDSIPNERPTGDNGEGKRRRQPSIGRSYGHP